MQRVRGENRGVGRRLARLTAAFIGPHRSIDRPNERKLARLFSVLMLVHVLTASAFVFVVNAVWLHYSHQTIWNDADTWVVLSGLAIIPVAFGLLRAGFYRVGVCLYIVMTLLVPLVAPFVPDPNAEIGLLATGIIPVVLAALAFSTRATLGVVFVLLFGSIVRITTTPMLPRTASTGYGISIALGVASFMVLVLRHHFSTLERETNEKVRQSEQVLRSFITNALVGVCITDESGNVVEWNRVEEQLSGFKASQVIGRPLWDVMCSTLAPVVRSEEWRARVESRIRRALDEGGSVFPEPLELDRVLADGRRVATIEIAFPIETPAGYRLGAITHDITTRKIMAQVLEAERDLYLALGRATTLNEALGSCLASAIALSGMDSGGIYTVRADGGVDLAVHQGMSPEFVRATSTYDPDSPNARIIGAGKPVYANCTIPELSHSTAIRDERLRALAVVPILHRQRAIACLNVASHSIEEVAEERRRVLENIASRAGMVIARIRAEEALRASEERFRNLSAMAAEGIMVHEKGVILEANQAFADLVGRGSPTELIGARGMDVVRFTPQSEQKIAEALRRSSGEIREVEVVRPDGTRIVAETHGRDINYLGRSARIVYMRDITDRVKAREESAKLQDQLQQAMKMEAVGRLAGGVAHDFNNLLTAILGNVELAGEGLKASDPPAQYLADIRTAAESAAALTRQLLAFSRRQIIEPRVLSLNDLVGNLEKMLRRLIGEDVVLKTVLSPDLGAVKIDAGQFEQVIVNLAVNARDAMPGGGVLVIETSNAVLDESYCARHPDAHLGRFVMLAVSDTGCGMTDEVRKHLFEPFFTTKPKDRGTGLGLATTFGAVKQVGGSVEVYSEVGRGTTFKIYLPRVEGPARELVAERRRVKELPTGHETVLIVEDDGIVRAFVERVFKRLGYVVLKASNGGEAIGIAEKHEERIDLLLTDVVMPEMNGRDLAARLRVLRPNMKVVYTSGYTENIIAHHGVVEENLNFLAKPYEVQTLAKKVRDVLDERPANADSERTPESGPGSS